MGGEVMRVVLFVLSVAAFLFGFQLLAGATTAIQEIEAFILFVAAAVLLVGASILDSLIVLRKELAHAKQYTSDVAGGGSA